MLGAARAAPSPAAAAAFDEWNKHTHAHTAHPQSQTPTPTALPASILRGSWLYFEFEFDLASSTVLQTDESGSTAAASRTDPTRSASESLIDQSVAITPRARVAALPIPIPIPIPILPHRSWGPCLKGSLKYVEIYCPACGKCECFWL